MPAYGTPQSGSRTPAGLNVTALQPGDSLALFNGETVVAPQASVAFARGYAPARRPGIMFTVDWAAQPTAQLQIQGSNQDVDGDYQTIATLQNNQHDHFEAIDDWTYYRVNLAAASAGGALTVIAQL